jgi:hypothetical protein
VSLPNDRAAVREHINKRRRSSMSVSLPNDRAAPLLIHGL